MKRLILAALICIIPAYAYANDIRVSVGEVKDSRGTGYFSELEIKLKVMGDTVSDAKGIKVKVTRAVDDTGRELLKDEERSADFTKPDEYGTGQAEVTVKLKNPARKASVVKEISGKVSIFSPKKDPNAVATVKDFMSGSGKPLQHPALKAAKVEVSVLTKKQYEEIKEKEKKQAKEKAGEMAGELGAALVKAFGSLFSGMMEIGENSVILSIADPESKVVDMEFMENGKRVKNTSSMRMGDVRVYEFENPMPQDAQMVIYLLTPQSLIKEPFKLTDIALP